MPATARVDPAALAIRIQRLEIERHRIRLVDLLGRTVSFDEAARDWIPRHAAQWRARFAATPHTDLSQHGIAG